jgi:broad specificity phosphatase PhoE
VSPSTRTIETAGPIVKSLGIEYKLFDELKERCFGVWDGLTFREIEEKYPEGLSRWKADQASYTPEGGESIFDLQKRVDSVLQWALQEYKGKKIVIVSHTGPIRVAVTQALQIPMINYRQLQIHPGSATRVDFGNSSVNLIYLGFLPGGNKV